MREVTVGKLSGIGGELRDAKNSIKPVEKTPTPVRIQPVTDNCKLVIIEGRARPYLIQNVGIEEPKFLNRKFKVEKQAMSIGKKIFLVVSAAALTILLASYAAAQAGFFPEEQHDVTPSTYIVGAHGSSGMPVGGTEMTPEQYQDYLDATENYEDEVTKGRGGR